MRKRAFIRRYKSTIGDSQIDLDEYSIFDGSVQKRFRVKSSEASNESNDDECQVTINCTILLYNYYITIYYFKGQKEILKKNY